ncbi:MAG: hypothetical protein KAX49_17255, partial [Halanaerobiales bacterium]|nr:hypothetical protein [Halanaerobiales bacterium]
MSADHFADVFPDILDFVKGEQPTAAKFNGMAQLIDGAFADITEGIGDPWDTQGHTCIGGDFTLSPKNLAQASLARIIGPSDYLSPSGVTLKEHHGANT